MKIVVLSSHSCFEGVSLLMKNLSVELSSELEFLSIFSDEEYREKKNKIQQILFRLKNYLFFPLLILFKYKYIKKKFDLIICITNPFYLPYLVSFLFPSKKKIIWLFDLYPESLVIHNIIRRGSKIENMLLKMTSHCIKNSDAAIYVLKSHLDFGISKNWKSKINQAIPHVSGMPSNLKQIEYPNDKTIILYCGTLGLMHDYSTMFTYFKNFNISNSISFQFYTSGSKKIEFENKILNELSDNVKKDNIVLSDSLSSEKWINKMSESHVGLVFQSKGAGHVIFPSKFVSIISMGQAILAICELDSELAHLITNYNCGWVVEISNVKSLDLAMKEIQERDLLSEKRKNSLKLYNEIFSNESIVGLWKDVINRIHN